MTSLLGEAHVRIRPDSTGFGPELNRGLAGSLKSAAGLITAVLAGAGIAAAAKSVLAIGTTYQDTMNNLQAVSGATADEMARVSARAKQLGSDTSLTATSAADAAIAMTELAKGGLSVDEAMRAAQGTLQLASAAGVDAAAAAAAAAIQSAALNAFNLEAEDSGRVADVLANAANAAAGEITDFGQALQAGGAVAAATGISIEDTAAALGILANNGIAGSDAGTLLKSALLALQSPSGPAAKAMETLGLTAYDAAGEFVGLSSIFGQLSEAQKTMTDEQYAAATSTLFGSDAARLAGIAGREGAEGFDLMADAMSRGGAAADVAAAKAKGVTGAYEAFKSQIETVQIEVFEALAPTIEGTLRRAGEAFSTFTEEVPGLWNALAGGDAQTAAESLDKILGGTGENVDEIRAAIEWALPVWDHLVDSAGNLVDVGGNLARSVGPALATVLGLVAGALGAAAPVLDTLTGVLVTVTDAFAELPGPIQTAVVALVALKVATSVGLLGRLAGRGGLTGALGSVGTSAVAAATNLGAVGDRMRGFGDTVAVQRALMEQTRRSTDAAAGGYGSMAARLGALTAAGSGTTTQLSRAQEQMRGYDRALGDAVRSSSPAVTAVSGLRDGFRQAADAHSRMVGQLTNGGTDRVASTFAGLNGAIRTLGRDGIASATTGLVNMRVAATTVATQGFSALRSGAGSLMGFLGGPWGVALTVATLAIGAITASTQKSAAEVDAWGDAIVEGGRKARLALDEALAMDESPTGFDAFQERVGNLLSDDSFRLNSEMEGYVSNVDRATEAARRHYESLNPLEQAQAKQAEWAATLTDRTLTLGQSHEDTRAAQERLAYWTDVLAGRQENADRATRTLTESIAASTQVALAGTNADLAASMATTQLTEGIQDYQTKLAEGTLTALEATQASDAMSQTALTTANSIAQQAYAHSTATTETGKQADADAALLASLKDTAAQLGTNTPAAITNLISSLENSSQRANATAGEMTDLGLSVLSIPSEREVIIDAPTAEQEQALRDLGYLVTTMPNGQVKVTADVSSAQSALAQFLNEPRSIRLGGYSSGGEGTGGSGGTNIRKALGGYIQGPGSATSDSIPALLSNGKFVVRAASVKKYGLGLLNELNVGRFAEGGLVQSNAALDNAISSIGGGRFDGGAIKVNVGLDLDSLTSAAQRLADAAPPSVVPAGPAGSGGLGSGWQSIFNMVKAAIPQARQNSTYRPGDPGYHGRGKAVDFGAGSGPGGAGSAGLASIASFLYSRVGRSLAELIYDGIGDNTPDVKNGRDHTYNAGTRAGHRNHVHAAVYDDGGVLEPGVTQVHNLSGKPEAILTSAQFATLEAIASQGGAP